MEMIMEKEISMLDGVVNMVSMRIFNKVGNGYSEDRSTQQVVDMTLCEYDDADDTDNPYINEDTKELDLKKSDYMLFNEAGSMFEIKYKSSDIQVVVKTRN